MLIGLLDMIDQVVGYHMEFTGLLGRPNGKDVVTQGATFLVVLGLGAAAARLLAGPALAASMSSSFSSSTHVLFLTL